MRLFLDTTFGVSVGLLNSSFEWVEYKFLENKKSSSVIHSLILEILMKNNLEVKDVKSLFYVAGPGSYTGMRVSQGIVDIFDWQNFEVFSFYHFDVPRLLGMKKGIWIGDAFKGEVFVHRWEDGKEEQKLYKKNDFELPVDIPLFLLQNPDEKDCKETQKLIKDNAKDLFKIIEKEKMKKELFYYRTIDMEFSRSK